MHRKQRNSQRIAGMKIHGAECEAVMFEDFRRVSAL